MASVSKTWQMTVITLLGGTIMLAAGAGRLLIAKKWYKAAILTPIIFASITAFAASFLVAGFGMVVGLIIVMTMFTVTTQVFSPKEANIIVVLCVIVAITTSFVDFLSPPTQLNQPQTRQLVAIVGIFTIIIFVAFTLYRFPTYNLPTRLIVAFLLVSLIPLGLLAVLNTIFTRTTLIDNANQVLLAAASQTADSLDIFITTNLNNVRTEAQIPVFADYLNTPADERAATLEASEVEAILKALSRRDRVFITSYGLLDIAGNNLVDTHPPNIGQNELDQTYFLQAINTGLPYVSPVQFSPESDQGLIFFSHPIQRYGVVLGVLRVSYRAQVLQHLIVASNKLAEDDAFPILLDEHNIRLAHGNDSSLIFQPITPLSAELAATLMQQQRLMPKTPKTLVSDSTNLPNFAAGLDRVGVTAFFTTRLGGSSNRLHSAAADALETQPWIVVFVQPQESFLAPIINQSRVALFLAIAIAGIVAAIAFWVGRSLSNPLTNLTRVVTQFTGGNLNARATITTQDEIGLLADSFNLMAEQVGSLLIGLEDRTGALEQSRNRYYFRK